MIKKINFVQLKIVSDARNLVLDLTTGKRLIVPRQVSKKPKTIGPFVKKSDYKYFKGENHD